MEQQYPIVLFDGVCNLCASSVQWIIRHDPEGVFRFASLQGAVGSTLQREYNIPEDTDSIVFIEDGRYWIMSDAALRIARHCHGWRWLYHLRFFPKVLRNAVYRLIAANRYRWFGKKSECWLPTPELKARFLD